MPSKTMADPKQHTQHIRTMLLDLAQHARNDVAEVEEPRARALFETSAEVLMGLAKAYEDYDAASEMAWRK
ncbi:MAG: hypothetical protein ACHQ50_16475 [Fimbriimonadales bacterium]